MNTLGKALALDKTVRHLDERIKEIEGTIADCEYYSTSYDPQELPRLRILCRELKDIRGNV